MGKINKLQKELVVKAKRKKYGISDKVNMDKYENFLRRETIILKVIRIR